MNFLYNLWLDMRQKAEKQPAPLLLHHDLDIVQRILRDQLTHVVQERSGWITKRSTRACCASCSASSRRW